MTFLPSDEIAWRLGEEAAAILHREATVEYSTALIERLRKAHGPDRANWLAEQIELRRRARAKFPTLAGKMYFTPRGLEQATDETTGRYKVERFGENATAADLCCGIGGDLQWLAQRASSVTAVDLDPWLVAVARANCAARGATLDRIIPRAEAAGVEHVAGVSAWHCDPDRRIADRRSTRIDLFSPSWTEIETLLAANPNAGIKLAPASTISPEWSERCEREWLSFRGECRQQMLWFGALARDVGMRRATALSRARSPASIVGSPDELFPVAREVRRFVVDPDASVLAAKLAGAACREWQAESCDKDGMYLTGDAPRDDGLGAWFEVDDVLPLDAKKIRSYVRERKIERLEMKTRGADVMLDVLRKKLSLPRADESATLIALRTASGVKAVFARRVQFTEPTANGP